MSTPEAGKPVYNVKNPCIAKVKRMFNLSGADAPKHTAHYEIDLGGSGLEYTPGDSLAVQPTNDPTLVDDTLAALGFSGEEIVKHPKTAADVPIRQALIEGALITEIDNKLIKAIIEKTEGDTLLADLSVPEKKDALKEYLWGRFVVDLLLENPIAKFTPQEFMATQKKLNIRLYSISSSQKAHPTEVHLTIATVRYTSHNRARSGVCSSFLAERVTPNETLIPCFVNHGKGFRLPDPHEETPVIMCGPGTGIAPFRAFLEERKATGAKGKAWLFFGEVSAKSCFFYREEFEAYLADGTLTKFSTAWSRDQAEKIYVQNKMLENSAELWAWLEQGAIFYVCGDAARMASDVDKALHTIVEQEGGKTVEEAAAYVHAMKEAKRYRRDVY
ncbi:sulfite reductase subunit alpha [Prosthecobacter sp.]|uniref:diflavin oxidoreductase n=1 Tax=Prosthecobacter sp. TaxID=1965333 RepID=UPI00248A1526|nr:sulfite reductase subunit alpha [Prosthecobacter sp.]MDI1313998.1 sulfite reductase subunit alpha [Prosthecobacter sp.]